MKEAFNNIAFANPKIDRLSEKRIDKDFIEALLLQENAKIILYKNLDICLSQDDNGRYFIRYFSYKDFADKEFNIVFVGLDESNAPIFAISLIGQDNGIFDSEEYQYYSLRSVMGKTNHEDLAIAAIPNSLFSWHSRHKYCSNCGHITKIEDAGWKRSCEACNAEHFPRTDPVAIMLILHEDKCLLGHNANFPEGFYSSLAGFVEASETFEAACKREAFEEAGIIVDNIKIIGNQPWPFPSQLMIAMVGYTKSYDLKLDNSEIIDAKWFTRDEVRQLISKEGLLVDGQILTGPRKVAVAGHLLLYWLENEDL